MAHPYRYAIQEEKGGKRRYILKDQRSVIGGITLKNAHASAADAETDGEVTHLARTKLWKKDLRAHHPQKAGLGHFSSDLFSRGKLILEDATYSWQPENISWSKWGWRDEGGKVVMTVSLEPGFLTFRGYVYTAKPLLGNDKKLALFGWYLLLLNHQNFGANLLHAVRHLAHQRN